MSRAPSAALRAWIEHAIEVAPYDGSAGQWPARIMKDHHVLLVHAGPAYLYYLAPSGELFELDQDDVRQALDPVAPGKIREVLAAAAEDHPQLAELVE